MTWTSSTRAFGFLSPADGTRDVFVCLSPDMGSRRVRGAALQRVYLDAPDEAEAGYHVRRPGSLDVIPEVFTPADVRRAGDRR